MTETKIRTQKWIAELGLCSRREAEKWILAGDVEVNGQTVTLGAKVNPEQDRLTIKGSTVSTQRKSPKVYWMFHKPDRTLSSREGHEGIQKIYDLPRLKKLSLRIFSVGRLDYRTDGLLLLTNDGEFANMICHPRFKIEKRYQVLVNGKLKAAELAQLRTGIELSDGKVKCRIQPGQGVNLGKTKGCWYSIVVSEGRNRLVRRIFEHFDLKVLRLTRYSIGPLFLDEKLAPGNFRQLTQEELNLLKQSASASATSLHH
ncbi:MAG: pseudouridine synthase [Zetaproteobacteria bacterium]|nr:pseudouridine synthase [Zetaproteobacteria bacterium]